jgi:hypothetical protein
VSSERRPIVVGIGVLWVVSICSALAVYAKACVPHRDGPEPTPIPAADYERLRGFCADTAAILRSAATTQQFDDIDTDKIAVMTLSVQLCLRQEHALEWPEMSACLIRKDSKCAVDLERRTAAAIDHIWSRL